MIHIVQKIFIIKVSDLFSYIPPRVHSNEYNEYPPFLKIVKEIQTFLLQLLFDANKRQFEHPGRCPDKRAVQFAFVITRYHLLLSSFCRFRLNSLIGRIRLKSGNAMIMDSFNIKNTSNTLSSSILSQLANARSNKSLQNNS